MWSWEEQRAVTKAIREEICRQHRDHERRTCPAGSYYYEEEISPYLIACAVEKTLKGDKEIGI